jgi:hypothetical protein
VWWDGVQVLQGPAKMAGGAPFGRWLVGLYENNRIPIDEHLYIDDVCVSASPCGLVKP